MSALAAMITERSRLLKVSTLISIITFGALLRFVNLGRPSELVFDEVYYVDGAQDYLKYGVEVEKGAGQFIVHPPVGKWMIAIGIKLFGDTPFGWRFTAALIGTCSIALIFFVARRLFDSYTAGALAATLTSLDGLHLVMSRTALLDIFLMFFLLLGFLFFLHDRHLFAAISFGLALGTKWNALYFITAILLYFLITKRRFPFVYSLTIPFTYLISWSGWFLSDKGWDRHYSSNAIVSWLHYHREILNFHTGLTTEHSYQANPWSWLVLGRPTSFFYATPNNCGGTNCSQEILAMSTPTFWWLGIIALVVTFGYVLYRRDHIAILITLGFASNFLPWLLIQERTMFFFYTIAMEPFVVLAMVYTIHQALGRDIEPGLIKQRKQLVLAAISLVALTFFYFLPLFTGEVLTYQQWFARMWLPSWI